MRVRSLTLRDWVVILFAAAGVFMLPWTIWLSSSLSPRHVSTHWDLAWSGFDSGLAVLFIMTAIAAYHRSVWVGPLAAALGTLLVTDAWFDIVLASHADELRYSILLAAFAELPAAAFCFWIAIRTERFLERFVEESRLHLAPAREGAAESDLVGVFEVPADGESAGKSGHADSVA